METAFEAAWWMPGVPRYADSLDDPGNVRSHQRHWIGVTPMEIELAKDGRVSPGLAAFDHGNAALDVRESPCFSTDFGLFHTGVPGCDNGPPGTGERSIFSLNTAVMAVGEGNYGRLGADQQQRYTAGEPAPAAARSGRAARRDAGDRSVARLRRARSTGRSTTARWSLQAWGTYGTLWPVVHQQLGVRPDMGRRRLEVTPQVPGGQSRVAGSNIRLGRRRRGRVGHALGKRSTTTRVALASLARLHDRPHAAARRAGGAGDARRQPGRLHARVASNRGLEVLVNAPTSGTHELVVTSR